MENKACVTEARDRGSSVMKITLSRLTLAKRRRSLNRRAQKGRTDLPSTLLKSPPKIHCLPGELNTKGYNRHYYNQTENITIPFN